MYIHEAEGLIRKTGALDELRKNLELKVWLFEMKPDYPKALRYAEELMVVKDSLLTLEKAESMLAMQARYETEKKEQQITMLEQDKALQQTEIEAKRAWIKSLIAIISLVSIIGLLLYHSYALSQQNKRKVETLLKELHHRVKNNLQILSSVLSLQSQYLKDDDTIQVIKSSESRVNTMALIHKKLYNDESSRTINMKEYISELSTYLIHTYGFSPEKIILNLNSDDINLDVDKAIPIGLILNELISNALKYAFASQPNPQLNINLKKINQNELMVEVSDNGMGISRDATQEPHSFGLKMVNTLITELKGKLTVTATKGTAYVLQIPIT
jgi:two-component sensor histidine kinase